MLTIVSSLLDRYCISAFSSCKRLRGRPVAEPKIMSIHSLAVALGAVVLCVYLELSGTSTTVGFHLADGCRTPAEMRIYPRALRIVIDPSQYSSMHFGCWESPLF